MSNNETLSIFDCKIPYNQKWSLCSCSIGQIMLRFCSLSIRKRYPKLYEINLMEFINGTYGVITITSAFEKCLEYTCEKDKMVRLINMTGPLPLVPKIINNVIIKDKNDRIVQERLKINQMDHDIPIGIAKLGKQLIPAFYNRLDFILTRESPYINNKKFGAEYNKYFMALREDVKKLRYVVKQFEENFVIAIDESHKRAQCYHITQKATVLSVN